ncbi:hypothetical protein DEO72_LG7g529 [Vigna unguiculata]|uniref:Uncharacterized protein n=1 Tax=Vigna unguiculata TaxID=3917 RepID=A0A4D6MG37_VIGUN|nr:hypothetical protein DEO72_LG7g529 [Vigna unguiculata]
MIVNFYKKLSHASPSPALCHTSITWNIICSRVTSHTIIATHTQKGIYDASTNLSASGPTSTNLPARSPTLRTSSPVVQHT